MSAPPLAPGTPVRRRDTGEGLTVHAVAGRTVFLSDADGQIEPANLDDFRPRLEVVRAVWPEEVQDYIARTIEEARRS